MPIAIWLSLAAAAPLAAGPVFEEDFPPASTVTRQGAVMPDIPGPRPPDYPGFPADNRAAEFGASCGYLAYPDPGEGSPLDFRHGDTVVLEAWVRLDAIQNEQNLYIVGKGRTGRSGFLSENQNYALRVRGREGLACLSFLFRSAANDAHPGDFHRWTARAGFRPGPAWHHLAVQFTFGQASSLLAWVDGQAVTGDWDMGGASDAAPVSDNDDLWIGSALGGAPGNTFRGGIDAVRIHRGPVAPSRWTAALRGVKSPPLQPLPSAQAGATRAGNQPPVLLEPLRWVPGRVSLDLWDQLGSHTAWPPTLPAPALRVEVPAFVLPRLPQRYDDWGIRADWQGTVLARLAAELAIAPGEYDLVLRGRGGTRVWLGDRVAAQTPFLKGSTDGHEPVPPRPTPPRPGAQPRGYGDREVTARVRITEPRTRVVLEALVGGARFRPEPGETLVALAPVSGGPFQVLSVDEQAPLLTELDWPSVRQRLLDDFARADDTRRRALAAGRDAYWERRRAHARAWAEAHPPAQPVAQVAHPVDAFLEDKRQAADRQRSDPGAGFPDTLAVRAILDEHCHRCHGDKDRGGLRLNARESALAGGDSGPALAPGRPQDSLLLTRILLPSDHEERMPPKGERLPPEQVDLLRRWISAGAPYGSPVAAPPLSPLLSDDAFLRRATLDTLGLFPTEAELLAFRADRSPDKRERAIDRLLADPRAADHWVSYWQDVLAENPNFVKPTLNNSGPFRWFLHDAFRDGKSADRWITELVLMRGSLHGGGSAGFGMAAENDVPLAHKGQILAAAFLGENLACARCHDSPYHATTQQDLFALAAMLERKPVAVPKTSTVPPSFFTHTQGRTPLIRVTLPPGRPVAPQWPFPELLPATAVDALLEQPQDARERLAALLTAPENPRFARVLVNRVWWRLFGVGLIDSPDDWEGKTASHPELLAWLAHDWVAQGYDLRHLQRRLMTSQAYQRQARPDAPPREAAARFFAAPERRRLSAEQLVDGLVTATGIDLRAELLSFDPEALRPAENQNNLGRPRRAWEFTSLSNERDRPSLAMPRNQAVVSFLETFGWRQNRAETLTCREEAVNVLQPASLANGVFGTWLTRLSETHGFTRLAREATSPTQLVETLTRRLLSRDPTPTERETLAGMLAPGFERRKLPAAEIRLSEPLPPLPFTSWSNHLSEEANAIKIEEERRARAGDPPAPDLRPEWRERLEDVVWALINAPEMVWSP
jgi:mono/diheme cytochrome c family protein